MQLDEFKYEVDKIVDLKKSKSKAYKSKRDKLEFYPGYIRNENEYRECTVHSKGHFPDIMLTEIAPNQTAEDKEYIERTYQCVTKNTFQNFSNTIKRAFQNGMVEWPMGENQTMDDFKEYLNEDIPQYGSFDFFMSNLVEEKLNDANAVCGVLPRFTMTEIDGDEMIDEVDPVPVIYNTGRVYFNTGDEYIVQSYEKSEVKVGKKTEMEGLIFILFDDDKIVWAIQTGKKDDYIFEYKEWEHGVGFVPCVRLYGSPLLIKDKLSFTSPFYAAVPNLNLAVLDSVNLLIIKRKVTYPTRVFVAETCQHQENGAVCNNGTLRIVNGEDEPYTKQCPGCRGTGKVGVFGPQSELMLNAAAYGENQIKAQDAMTYVAPSVDVPKFLREEINNFIDTAEQVLFLKAEPRSSGDITATEKSINAVNTEALIKPISDQLTYIYRYLVETIGFMRYDDDVFESIKPTIKAPERFEILKSEDYIAQMIEAADKGLPKIVTDKILFDYLRSINFSDSQTAQVFTLLEVADPLLTIPQDEIALGLSRGTITKNEAILHQRGLSLIMGLILEDDKFLEKEIDEQIAALEMAAGAIAASTNTTFDLPPPEEI